MLDAPELPVADKAVWRLALEVRTFVGAGTETTGNTLSVTVFHLLSNPDMSKRVKEEVQAAQKQSSIPLTYQQLARLPYLVSPFFASSLSSLVANVSSSLLRFLKVCGKIV